VANRSIERSSLFPTPETRDEFVSRLGEIAYGFAAEINAYCVLESHYHVLVRGEEPELRRAFAWLDGDRSPAMEGARFRPMTFGRHLLQVTRYIHRNAVEAGLARRPGAWRWSSYLGYVDPLYTPPWLRTSAVLGLLGSIGVRQLYRRYVEGLAKRPSDRSGWSCRRR